MPKKGSTIDFDLEATPLAIKTDSTIGSGDPIAIDFYGANNRGTGGFVLVLSSPPKYLIANCMSKGLQPFPSALPTAADNNNVWRLTLTRTSGIRFQIHLNDKEGVNFPLSDSTCTSSSNFWSSTWGSETKKIILSSTMDKATDFYRAGRGS